MGALDAAAKNFMEDKRNFADAFNLGLFREERVRPESLRPVNADLVTGIFQDGEARVWKETEHIVDGAQSARIVMEDGSLSYAILVTQYQMDPHYAMPVRCMGDAWLGSKIGLSEMKGGRINMCKAIREIEEEFAQLARNREELARKEEELAQSREQLAQKDREIAELKARLHLA